MKAAVLGYGTVGSGVVHVIEENHDVILEKSGIDLEVKYVLDLRDFPGDPIQERIVHDFKVIEEDPEIGVVAEVMGGTGAAYEFTKRLLKAGKSVSTSNKELVAQHGTELLDIARENHVSYMFEASCGGGIPIIRPLRTCLNAERIDEITGIVNGTTNYILTKMIEEDLEFSDALKEAQDMGYAERNPEADIEGHDACRKIAILSSLAYGKRVDYKDIYTEGISRITASDIRYAEKMGKTIKLLAYSHLDDGKVLAMVAPYLVGQEDPLGAVKGVFNAIFVHGNMLGDAMFYGKGAGKDATASAVVSDLIEQAQTAGAPVMSGWSDEKQEMQDVKDSCRQFLVRIPSDEESLRQAAAVFGGGQFVNADIEGETGLVTGILSEKDFADRLAEFGKAFSFIRIRD